jgi:hypothetical protein
MRHLSRRKVIERGTLNIAFELKSCGLLQINLDLVNPSHFAQLRAKFLFPIQLPGLER